MDDNFPDLSAIEEQALLLAQAAVGLDQARAGARDPHTLATALEANLEVWVAIRAIIDDPNSAIADNIRDNLRRLCDFIAESTFTHGINMTESRINTLININFQISEGLLEGAKQR